MTSADGPPHETAYLHLVVDASLPDSSVPIPDDELHRQFGVEQTELTLDLKPGLHTLQLVVGDGSHVPHAPPIASEPVSFIVSNLEVWKTELGDSSQLGFAVDIPFRLRIRPEPFEDDIEGRRARKKERARVRQLLDILVEEIQRTKRERAAEKRRGLTLEVEEPPEA